MTDCAITVQNLCKSYKLYAKPIDRLKEALNFIGRKYHKDFLALDKISFTVQRGETIGILGKNGSGKSTLLKIITGILNPTSGSVEINGKISALLELGAGFNPDLTGIENIYFNGTIMGYSRSEMDQKLESILSFADIGDFVYQPVKVYSSGMFVRLAFAVAINVDPDILIIDEALSVGDIRFQQKCFRKIDEFKGKKTILIVSHDLGSINKYCDRVIWINEGTLVAEGAPKNISKQYQAYMLGSQLTKSDATRSGQASYHESSLAVAIDDIATSLDILGDNKARIIGISLFDASTGQKTTILEPGQAVQMGIKIQINEDIDQAIIGFSMVDRLGNIILQSNSYVLNDSIDLMQAGEMRAFCFEFTVPPLSLGQYSISPAIASGTLEEHTQHSWVHDALLVQVIPEEKYQLSGILNLTDVKFFQI